LKSICVLFILIIFSFGCNNPAESGPDTSGIKIDLRTRRFDKDLYSIDTNHIGEGLTKLKAQYPGFLNYFLDTLMAYELYGNFTDTVAGIREGLKPFLVYKDYRGLEDSIIAHYPDTKKLDGELEKGFKLMKYYFPGYKVPEVIYLNMGLSAKWPTFPLDSTTQCIALDMFLGDQYPHYVAVGIPQYLNTHLRESYVPVSVFSSIYGWGNPWTPQEKTLLELMLDKGREKYYVHMLLPSAPDSVLFGFGKKQIDWCNANEAFVYNFFVQNKLLYSKVAMDIMSYVSDGPFARGLEPVSNPEKTTPGNIGTWLGYKMVCAYMAQNPNTTLKELLEQKTEPVQFLDKARYKPR